MASSKGRTRELDWVIVDEELHTYINDQQREIDTYLLGRRMYAVMVYWDTANTDPSNPEYALELARIWKNMHKIVFSKTLEHVPGNATLGKGNIVEEIARLRAKPGKNMSVGGASIASTLTRLGLIDEYWLYVQPVVLGRGTPMFPTLDNKINLRLVETCQFGSGVVLLRYQLDRDESK